jgi:hypothetical protein
MSEKLLDLLSDAASELRVRAEEDRMCGRTGKSCDRLADELLDVVEALERPFKRSGDPGSCGYRCSSAGVSFHCRLESGHQPLGHDFLGEWSERATDECVAREAADAMCGRSRAAHGRAHALEVSDRYVLEHLDKL